MDSLTMDSSFYFINRIYFAQGYLPVIIGNDVSVALATQENTNDTQEKINKTAKEEDDTTYLNTNIDNELAAILGKNEDSEVVYVNTMENVNSIKDDETSAYVNQDVQVDDENTMTTTCQFVISFDLQSM